jgi:formylglycine-generating enzyme
MVWIPGGTFWMGLDKHDHELRRKGSTRDLPDTKPIHSVTVDGFWIDETEVTNAQFAAFVRTTGYVTIAEQAPRAEDLPGVPIENLVAGSIVFVPPNDQESIDPAQDNPYRWWAYVPGADWKHPTGPGSSIETIPDHPVVHVAWPDAVAYAAWAGKQLPTEAQWERAARGGLDRAPYPWGETFQLNGRAMANTFQGTFPSGNTSEDGFASTAPVKSFPPNAMGLYDVGGNVWEWCSDWYRPDYYDQLVGDPTRSLNPQGPRDSVDPFEPAIAKRVMKGGSFLCTDQYCSRYMPGARGKGDPMSAANHIGFRLVRGP